MSNVGYIGGENLDQQSLPEETKQKIARQSGFLFLLMGLTVGFGHFSVRQVIFDYGDITKSIQQILEFQTLFRLGSFVDLVGQVVFILLVFKLFRLFGDTDQILARLMTGFACFGIAISFLSLATQLATLDMVLQGNTSDYNSGIQGFLAINQYSIVLSQVFWGLWLWPLGKLIYKSGFIPKIFGLFMLIGCIGYVLASTSSIILPHLSGSIALPAAIVASLSELALIGWLCIKGIQKEIQ